MRPADKPPRWFDHQVATALLVGLFAGGYFQEGVLQVAGKWLAAPPRYDGPTGYILLWLAAVLFIGGWWARPVARFLVDRDPALRAKAWLRFNGLFRFLGGLWLASAAVQMAISRGLSTTPWDWAQWTTVTLSYGAGAYYGAYFTMLFLEPLIFPRVARCFYDEVEIFKPKAGPLLSVHARLTLLVLNLVLLPLLLLELKRRVGVTGDYAIVVVTFVFAAGSLETLYHSIAKPLDELNRKMTRLAEGDYAVKTTVLDDDEIGVLKAHFNDMVDGLSERERLKDTFGRYVSVEVAKKLIESGKVSLGGESIEATILFSDIRDFTPLSETLTPQQLVGFLNSYFSYVTEPITAHGGMVNKFIGDAVMAVFAPQFGSKDHVADGVRAALGMREALARFNASRPGLPPVAFGVGLHTGTLVAGNIGTEKRLEYTVIGDTVNIASRIESHNKELESTILVSEEVYSRLPAPLREEVRAQRCEDVRLKGKQRALVLYKLA